ncbi:MAG TPA: oxygenase MpaB family protein [Nevskiaceae bacterium]|nr:oxygenase MpaB family protein [Nevskiaceae bacterium]
MPGLKPTAARGRRWREALRQGATAPIKRRILAVIASHGRGTGIDYDEPEGDAGLFGPDSVVWRVHADFPAMMAGGICALMLQALHPLALAGVHDHADFQHDVLGRLRRTIGFVSATTYGPTAAAQQRIERVCAIHHTVRGVARDGRPYSADDPALLTWVHCAEMWSFMHGYMSYRGVTLPLALQDRYYDETRRVAEALGACDVPRTAGEIDAYFQQLQPQLRCDADTRAVLGILDDVPLPVPASGLVRGLFLHAGSALLPDWGRRLLARDTRALRLRDRAAARCLRIVAPALRAAMMDGIAARSCRRVGLDPKTIYTGFSSPRSSSA